MSRTATKAVTSRGKREAKAARPALPGSQEREAWQIQIRPEFRREVRKLAIDRDVSAYDILDEAVSAYLRNQA
jgi:hypothetical protein